MIAAPIDLALAQGHRQPDSAADERGVAAAVLGGSSAPREGSGGLPGGGLHSSTSQLNVSTFCGVQTVHFSA
jgi:hypothetical protein